MPTGQQRTQNTGDNDMSGLELGKAAGVAGAWAWKCRLETRRTERFENSLHRLPQTPRGRRQI